MKKVINSTWVSAVALAISSVPAHAQTINLKGGGIGELANLTIPAIISALIRLSIIVAAVVFFFMLVIGGIKWILSGGDKGKTEEARNQITAALVGLVIVFSAWAIIQLIGILFGVNLFELQPEPITKFK